MPEANSRKGIEAMIQELAKIVSGTPLMMELFVPQSMTLVLRIRGMFTLHTSEKDN